MDLPSTALKITSLKGLDSSSINAFTVQGVNLIVLNNDQHISVFHANCPHQGSDLSTARLQQGRLVCPMHQWQFDQLTGERVDQPGSCLQAFDSLTYNGDLYIDAFGLKQFQQFRNSNVFQSTGPADQRIKHLPGPKALPLLGNMLQLKISVLHLLLRDWSQRYGKIFRLKLPMGTAVVLSDSICIRQLLRERPHSFRRPSNFPKLFSEINGHGVFSEEGDNWQRQRRLLVPALNLAQLDDFFPKMNLGLERLYQKWSNEANQQKVSNICSDFANLTGDIATHVTLGHDINMQQGKSDPLQSAIRTILQRITERSIAAIPYWRFIKLPKDRAVDRALVILHNAVNDFINHAKQRMTNQSQANSFLDALVSWQDEQGKTLSDKEIQGNVLTMIAAGGDTTAHTMSWLLYFMCLHPHIQERMQHEVDQFSGDPLKLHSADQFKHFPYIKASVQEAMRLKPVAPVMFFEPCHDVTIENTHIPKGTLIMVATDQAGLDENHFSNAHEFAPERWLQTNKKFVNHQSKTAIPFGYGPRLCPGRPMALTQLNAVMAMISKNFNCRLADNHPPVEEKFEFTMQPNLLQVQFSLRD